jgi:hypothetical protein
MKEFYTDAPKCYDSFGTSTVEALDVRTIHGQIRRVAVHEDHVEWQIMRYQSGLYVGLTPEQWGDFRDLVVKQG